jgi:hypothetical protein
MLSKILPHILPNPGSIAILFASGLAKIKVREQGQNRGRWVDAIIELGGGDDAEGNEDGSAWCAYFVNACLWTGALVTQRKLLTKTSGGVTKSYNNLKPEERISVEDVKSGGVKLQPGDVFYRVRDASKRDSVRMGSNTLGHEGFAIRLRGDGWIVTIEGNTDSGDSAEGSGVFMKMQGIHIDDPRLIAFGRPTFSARQSDSGLKTLE